MRRSRLHDDSYRPQLSGHETFPLRHGWLKKVCDAVNEISDPYDARQVFLDARAIARFGVGKNMVRSMRHWAVASGIIEDPKHGDLKVSSLGNLLFDDDGLDPYMESPDTSWLIHWNLAGHTEKTTCHWAFNYYPALTFSRDDLVKGIKNCADDRKWRNASVTTIKRDVACFVRSYVSLTVPRTATFEDTLESPLAELGLIREMGARGLFRFVRGPKPSLGALTFCYALTDFWNGRGDSSNTLSFESIAHEPGSPGRVFQLDEDSLVDKLSSLAEVTDEVYQWSEAAGLKQIVRNRAVDLDDVMKWMRNHATLDIGERSAA